MPHITICRRCIAYALACWWAFGGSIARAQDDWERITPQSTVLLRHATAPGGGDPPGFDLQDCNTQRNLSAEGQAQAKRIGEAFAQRGIRVAAVWSSQWCRARDTADLAFPGLRKDQAVFNSFFNTPERGPAQTQAATAWLAANTGKGVTVVVSHQINITTLTGIFPASGEGIVVEIQGNKLQVLGRISP